MGTDGEKPNWWMRNQADREALDLPEYEPPRFEDGVYVHDVVPDLEAEHDCEITLLGINVDYLDEWTVRIDGTDEFQIERSRDDSGNTIYHLDSETFVEEVRSALGGDAT